MMGGVVNAKILKQHATKSQNAQHCHQSIVHNKITIQCQCWSMNEQKIDRSILRCLTSVWCQFCANHQSTNVLIHQKPMMQVKVKTAAAIREQWHFIYMKNSYWQQDKMAIGWQCSKMLPLPLSISVVLLKAGASQYWLLWSSIEGYSSLWWWYWSVIVRWQDGLLFIGFGNGQHQWWCVIYF